MSALVGSPDMRVLFGSVSLALLLLVGATASPTPVGEVALPRRLDSDCMRTCFIAPPPSPPSSPPSGSGGGFSLPVFTCASYITPQYGECAETCTDEEFSAFLVPAINALVAYYTSLGIIPSENIGQLNGLKTCKLPKARAPCFPSEALVTMADGTPRPLSALRAGDAIIAASADGTLTTDTVSLLSLADADVQGTTFVVLTTASGRSLTLTPTHHVPVGAACCADLKQAKDIAVGETVYEAVSASAAVSATQVKEIGTATKPGLHSPVLSHGTMPIVNGVATSFDELYNVRLASYNASYGLPLLAKCAHHSALSLRCASPPTGCRCSRRPGSLPPSATPSSAPIASTLPERGSAPRQQGGKMPPRNTGRYLCADTAAAAVGRGVRSAPPRDRDAFL